MRFTGDNVDKIMSTALYILLMCLVTWAGFRIVNYALETRFYKDFLIEWEIAVKDYSLNGGSWPLFKGNNHIEYMDSLVSLMKASDIPPPHSNTKRPFVYRLRKIGPAEEQIFLLCFSDKIILYGLSEETFRKIDGMVDDTPDETAGAFTGRRGKEGTAYIGVWKL